MIFLSVVSGPVVLIVFWMSGLPTWMPKPTSPRTLLRCWPPMRKPRRRNILLLVLLSNVISLPLSCLLMASLAVKLMLWFVSWLSPMLKKLTNPTQWSVALYEFALALLFFRPPTAVFKAPGFPQAL